MCSFLRGGKVDNTRLTNVEHVKDTKRCAVRALGTQLFKGQTEARIHEFKTLPPLERLGLPEDIANVVSFLAGPDGGWVNAQVLRANGGFA
jgi:NAD(P)-dependent dehydrogenase (short-subunit alcohol dehydrogenase family)